MDISVAHRRAHGDFRGDEGGSRDVKSRFRGSFVAHRNAGITPLWATHLAKSLGRAGLMGDWSLESRLKGSLRLWVLSI
jgi:hypothetical protein